MKISKTIIQLLTSFMPIAKYRRKLRRKILNGNPSIPENHCMPEHIENPEGLRFREMYTKFKNLDNITILTTPHCLYIARLIKINLKKIGILSTIITSTNTYKKDEFYILVSPILLKEFPEKYIVFQLEQLETSAWFCDTYFDTLKNAFAIWDYSTNNIRFLQDKGIDFNKLFYLPIDILHKNRATVKKKYDVVFYGATSSERRNQFLNKLKEHFNICIIENLFGEELETILSESTVLVNIHYYDNALLETTRLYEALSLGCFIISESSSDLNQYANLSNLIVFTEENNPEDMVSTVAYWLEHEKERQEFLQKSDEIRKTMPDMFAFYMMRFLLAYERINFNTFWELANHNITFTGNKICLSLPESQDRLTSFNRDNAYGFEIFPGLRANPGWIGCGMSYKFLMKKAIEARWDDVIICEDDVEFPDDFEQALKTIKGYLSLTTDDWHLFSGFIADLAEETKILATHSHKDMEFVHLNKMTSMVFSIFRASFYDKLASWDETDQNITTNTIDRFIEGMNSIMTITTNPYLVGHKRELDSTLWGFEKNCRYDDMTNRSINLLSNKIKQYKSSQMETEIKAC